MGLVSGACLESLCSHSRAAGSFLGNVCFSGELFPSWGFIACSELEFSQTNFSSVSRLGFNQIESFMVEGGNCMIFRDYFLTQNREQIKKYSSLELVCVLHANCGSLNYLVSWILECH